MNCRQAAHLLPGYLDGAVQSHETNEIRAHLTGCASCRDILDHYRRLSVALANVTAVLPPADLLARIRSRAAEAKTQILRRQNWRSRTRILLRNIFEPLAIPATGGILAAMFAFLFVVQGILAGVPVGEVVDDRQGQCLLRREVKIHCPFGKFSLCQDVIEADHAVRAAGELA